MNGGVGPTPPPIRLSHGAHRPPESLASSVPGPRAALPNPATGSWPPPNVPCSHADRPLTTASKTIRGGRTSWTGSMDMPQVRLGPGRFGGPGAVLTGPSVRSQGVHHQPGLPPGTSHPSCTPRKRESSPTRGPAMCLPGSFPSSRHGPHEGGAASSCTPAAAWAHRSALANQRTR